MTTEAARILIVDDQEANREILADQMSLLGHECLLAENGLSALAQIETKKPDRLSLALKEEHDMEVVGEAEAVLQITQGSSSPKVVIVSAHSDSRFVGLMLYGGATGSCFSRTPSRHSRGYHESHIHRFWSSGRHKVGTATMKGDSARTRRESQE